MELEDHLAAAENLVRQIERGEMRLSEAINAFREACHHLAESERLLGEARVEVERILTTSGNGAGALTEPLSVGD